MTYIQHSHAPAIVSIVNKEVPPGILWLVQWLRVHLPMQRMWVQSLVWEDPTCMGQLNSCVTTTKPELRSKRSHRDVKPVHHI